ncbi:cobalamin-dependent protein [uncultured Tateyamaria sp.]|uniref:cobalamin B12-binding domain-containing protein n=1 Tax=uncultured Tateyamaria sp. TaxID=455651 RepID=UPI0026185442|nr:cobalamin-dependent protein [uncultured Tateyamaria sp.]
MHSGDGPITGFGPVSAAGITDMMDTTRQFSSDVYQKTHTDVRSLKAKLPEDSIGSIVEEILNRIKSRGQVSGDSINAPSPERVEKLAYALISDDDQEGARFIQDVREDGASLEAVYLAYLAQAAYRLGEWWTDDHVSFVEVTVGTSRIYSIMRGLSHLFTPRWPVEVKSAVFATVPGETHVLGIRMARDLFSKEGWDIDLKIGKDHDTLVDEIAHLDCTVIGLSAAGGHSAAALAKLVLALRISNPGAQIFLSGNIVNDASDLVALMDLDGIATDADAARKIMNAAWQNAHRA